jgi:hypothetical protein
MQRNLFGLEHHAHAAAPDLAQQAKISQPLNLGGAGGLGAVDELQADQASLQLLGEVRVARNKFFPAGRLARFQFGQIAIQNLHQLAFHAQRLVVGRRERPVASPGRWDPVARWDSLRIFT